MDLERGVLFCLSQEEGVEPPFSLGRMAQEASGTMKPSAERLPTGASYFLSGVMQGRKAEGEGVEGTVPQDYRGVMKAAVLAADPSATVIEPWDLVGAWIGKTMPDTPQAEVFKDTATVRKAFTMCVEAAANADVVVSYLPEASMGSAVELYAAQAAGRTIIAIAPGSMAHNWVVRSYGTHLLTDIDKLQGWLTDHIRRG
jgi:hypothetical protein